MNSIDNHQPLSLYSRLGGETRLRAIVHRFYELMDTLPEARGIRVMHENLASSEEKLFAFLSGWTGGPQLYMEKYGHPMLRRRHLHFAIGVSERDQWMLCMEQALRDCGIEEPLLSELVKPLARLADHMRNQEQG